MSFWNRLTGRTKLTNTDRATILKFFGSFNANKLGTSQSALLTEGYESNVDVYTVINKIIIASKLAPWIVEQRDREGNWVILEDTTIHELMAKPNKDKGYTWQDIDEQLTTYLLATGNSFMPGVELSGKIVEVDILPSPAVTASTSQNFFLPNIKYKFDLGSQSRKYNQEDLEHIRLFNPGYDSVQDSILGLSPIQVAARAVQVGNDRWDADANLLQNRGAIGMITDKSNRPMRDPEAQRMQEAFELETAGPHNFGKIKVTNKDLSFIQMAMSSTDLQLVEKGPVTLRAICNVFGLDSSLFNDPANKTFNNRAEATKDLYTGAVIPISNKKAAKHTQYIALNHYPDGSVRMRQDFSETEALQKDKKTEAEKDLIVINGVREVVNMPISPEAKESLLQSTYDISEEQSKLIASTIDIRING
jgi:HK97 family phage portal protein